MYLPNIGYVYHKSSHARSSKAVDSNTKKNYRGTQTARAWNKFLKPASNVAALFIGMAAAAESKNPQVAPATTNLLKSTSGGKLLSLTDILGKRLRIDTKRYIKKIKLTF